MYEPSLAVVDSVCLCRGFGKFLHVTPVLVFVYRPLFKEHRHFLSRHIIGISYMGISLHTYSARRHTLFDSVEEQRRATLAYMRSIESVLAYYTVKGMSKRTSSSRSACRTFSSNPASTMFSSLCTGSGCGTELHRWLAIRVGDSTLDLGDALDFVANASLGGPAASESSEWYGWGWVWGTRRLW